ncbi:hypothetical protein MMC11_009101 [Xylographa trunciseda]|nr:hypothetical protein [Xylographa trunciseda]
MRPRHKPTTQEERAKENNSVGMRKDRKPTSPLKNASPRKLRSSTTAAAYSTPSEAFQKPSETSQELIDRPRKAQKRKHTAEDEHSQKRSRKDLPSVSVPVAASQDPGGIWQTRVKKLPYDSEDKDSYKQRRGSVLESQLSEENLKKLERDLEKLERGTLDEMDPGVTVSDRGRKRAPSRQASLSDLNQDTASLRSQKPSISNSIYRYQILDQARIYVRPEPPPTNIQAQMDVIFEREIPEKRRSEISVIAKKISQKFVNNLRGSHREDDLVELVYEALHMMHEDEAFDFPRKAGIVLPLFPIYTSLRANLDLDWDPRLKPDVQQEVWNWDALNQSNNEADDVVDRSNKRQQGVQSFPSPDTSQSTMPPPAAPSQSKQDAVKTPRPDFTIGLRHSTISHELIKRGLSKFKADDFLKFLQRERKLYSDPTQNFLSVRFPILVIEGKAYATGKTVYEAQNQAAVSGACMINLQQQLTDLFEGVFFNLRGRKIHLAFSICTEGPQIEFWVHYALSEDNVRSHYMNIFRTCYASLHDGLEDFLIDVERLMRWTQEDFLKEVADQLYKLANHAARG